MRFHDKVCIVTGGGSGIGKDACLQFAREGGKVLVADLNEQHGNATALEIVRSQGDSIFVKWDVGDPDHVKSAIKIAVESAFRFSFCKYSVPHRPRGSAIVRVSSVHAHETTKNVPYALSKGGIEAFTRGFAEELAAKKIRINCVAPGAVDTPMPWNNPNVKRGVEKVECAVGKPEDIAAAICFLAAPEARFIRGTTLVVDGGRLDILP